MVIKYSVLVNMASLSQTLKDMKYFGLSKYDIDEDGYVTLYHGGIELPVKLKRSEILFLTPDYALAKDYARMRGGKVFTLRVKPTDVFWNQGSQEVEYTKGGRIEDGVIIPPERKKVFKPRKNVTEEFKGVKVGDILPKTQWAVQDIVLHDNGRAQFLLQGRWYDAAQVIEYEFGSR